MDLRGVGDGGIWKALTVLMPASQRDQDADSLESSLVPRLLVSVCVSLLFVPHAAPHTCVLTVFLPDLGSVCELPLKELSSGC